MSEFFSLSFFGEKKRILRFCYHLRECEWLASILVCLGVLKGAIFFIRHFLLAHMLRQITTCIIIDLHKYVFVQQKIRMELVIEWAPPPPPTMGVEPKRDFNSVFISRLFLGHFLVGSFSQHISKHHARCERYIDETFFGFIGVWVIHSQGVYSNHCVFAQNEWMRDVEWMRVKNDLNTSSTMHIRTA